MTRCGYNVCHQVKQNKSWMRYTLAYVEPINQAPKMKLKIKRMGYYWPTRHILTQISFLKEME